MNPTFFIYDSQIIRFHKSKCKKIDHVKPHLYIHSKLFVYVSDFRDFHLLVVFLLIFLWWGEGGKFKNQHSLCKPKYEKTKYTRSHLSFRFFNPLKISIINLLEKIVCKFTFANLIFSAMFKNRHGLQK